MSFSEAFREGPTFGLNRDGGGGGKGGGRFAGLRRMILSYPSLRAVRELTGPAQETRALAGQVESLRMGSSEALRRARETAARGRLGSAYVADAERTLGFDLARSTGIAEREAKARTAFASADIQRQVFQNLTDLKVLRYMGHLRKMESRDARTGAIVQGIGSLVGGVLSGGVGGGAA